MNFDFHNLLSSSEFENLCRDILELREENIKFTTYRKGKDGGIDIKSTNTKLKIIGQCKLYNPNNYNALYSSLKKEVIKCNRQKPDRYIICTNVELSPFQAENIKNLFVKYILNEEDIIDGIKLNKYLGEYKFEQLFKTYSKLLVPNFTTIEHAIDQTINRKYYNKTISFLNDIKTKRNLFHHTNQISSLIQKLEEDKVIILSGNPGVGKTTTAKIISNYFLSKKVNEIIFLEERDYTDVLSISKENQLIIIDDFWGQNFSPDIRKYSSYEREFQNIIKHFTDSNNKYLILTSRDYIIKDICLRAEYEVAEIFDYSKFIININTFSFNDKLKIFLNHLQFYDFDLSYYKELKYTENLDYIINHENYSPRLIEQFIKIYNSAEIKTPYIFFKSFLKYLERPLDFWKNIFCKLNPTGKLILFILLISGDELEFEDLKNSFLNTQLEVRQILNINIDPTEFRNELIKLEEIYITITNDQYYNIKIIKFQNPGIKDYLLEYLRTDGYAWIQPLLLKAIFFNQLTYIFGVTKKKIYDDSETYLFGEKIVLNSNLLYILKEKIINEFDQLNFSNYEERCFADQKSRFYNYEEIKYLKLVIFNDFFNLESNENVDVKNFILNIILEDFHNFNSSKNFISSCSMIYFPGIIKNTYKFLNLKPQEILKIYHDNIRFAEHYDYFYDFDSTFPVEFKEFYNKNLLKFKKNIKTLIFDDIDYYLYNDLEGKLDMLCNYYLENIAIKYKIRMTKKFIKEIELASNLNILYSIKDNKTIKKDLTLPKYNDELNKYKHKPSHPIIDEFLPSNEIYDPKIFLIKNNYHVYLKEIKNAQSLLFYFKNNSILFEVFCNYLFLNNIILEKQNFYNIIDGFFHFFIKKINYQSVLLIKLFVEISNELEQSNDYSIAGSKLKTIIKLNNLSLEISDLNPIITPFKNWFKFSSDYFEIYFLAKYISNLDDEKFKNQIQENLYVPEEFRLLKFLEVIDKERLWKVFIIPEIRRLLNSLDHSNEKSKIISFVNFFKIEFDLEWNINYNSFELFSSYLSEIHFEQIFSICEIKFSPDDLEYYFSRSYQNDERINRLKINTAITLELEKAVLYMIDPIKAENFVEKNEIYTYNIKLSEFIETQEIFDIINKIGMKQYLNLIIEDIMNISSNYI